MVTVYCLCGTDTNVGKSVVCAGLLKNMPYGQAIKIVQTGEALLDQNLYAAACPQGRSRTLRHFMLPASPHLAASREQQRIDLAVLAREVQAEALQAQVTLLEGSGGVMTPLSATETFLDFMVDLGYPVILVIANVLGAINHALLSLDALKRAGLRVEGLIFTHPDAEYPEDHPVAIDNMASIQQHSQTDILGVVPHLPELPQAGGNQVVWGRVATSLQQAATYLTGPEEEKWV